MSRKMYYYAAGNTAKGFVNFIQSNIEDIDLIITLHHPVNKLKSAVLKELIAYYCTHFNVEIILSTLGAAYTDGLIIRERSIAILDERISDEIKGNVHQLDLTQWLRNSAIRDDSRIKLQAEYTENAYAAFRNGLKIHDQLEDIFIKQMDFYKADQLADEFIANLLGGLEPKERSPKLYRRLFGTNTAEGAVNIVPSILATIGNVYHIKGRAGTGKSTFMKKVLAACHKYGFDIELYHCSFDPNSIDMVLVRDLDFCIFDSTDPHELPQGEGEHIIDMYEKTVKPETDDTFAEEINRVTKAYKTYMKKGIAYLKKAGTVLEEMEREFVFSDGDIHKVTTEIKSICK